ncbi:MAG: hypothetical protein PHP44_05535 [Kiritimatiellae bacterium]|nr:hypothetical protein [Kiritimatiellia bacterium]
MKTDNETTDCPLCGKLRKTETSFSKYESGYPDTPLPPEAGQLNILHTPTTTDINKHHVRRCPQCGAFFDYLASHEYFINGTEEEEELTRMNPEQITRWLQTEVATLETLRRDTELYRDQAGRLGDYLDRAHPSPQEQRDALNDMQESGKKADELQNTLETWVNTLRTGGCPEILHVWSRVHIRVCDYYLNHLPHSTPEAADLRSAALSTRDAWQRLPTEPFAFIASGEPWLNKCNERFDRELATLRVS